jgi:hypothetical protein
MQFIKPQNCRRVRLRVSENNMLRKTFGLKRREVTGQWSRLYSEVLYKLHSTPNIIRAIKSRRMRWAEHAARMGEGRDVYRGGGET